MKEDQSNSHLRLRQRKDRFMWLAYGSANVFLERLQILRARDNLSPVWA
jgi:hypothetical protein